MAQPKRFDVEKQFRFALASALTATAKKAQAATIADIRETFSVRTQWLNPTNAMGIKALPASKDDLTAAVATRAEWLVDHESGQDRVPQGHAHRAVPTINVRRTKRQLIQKSQRPRNLKDKAFKVTLKNGGEAIFARVGRGKAKRLVMLYYLIKRAQIDKESTVGEQTVKAFDRHFNNEFAARFAAALRSAK